MTIFGVSFTSGEIAALLTALLAIILQGVQWVLKGRGEQEIAERNDLRLQVETAWTEVRQLHADYQAMLKSNEELHREILGLRAETAAAKAEAAQARLENQMLKNSLALAERDRDHERRQRSDLEGQVQALRREVGEMRKSAGDALQPDGS